MTWNDTLTYKSNDEDTHELHVLNVYADPEFVSDMQYIAKNGTDEIDRVILSGLLPNDQETHNLLADERLATTADISKKYCLTMDEIIHFAGGFRGTLPLPRDKPFKVNWDEYDDQDSFSVSFETDIKKEDFMQIWKLIRRKQIIKHGGKTFKRKPVENDKLVYAIFKAKIKGDRFSRTFRNYQKGSLEGCSGSSSQYQTEESLERYYKKHKPTINDQNSGSDV